MSKLIDGIEKATVNNLDHTNELKQVASNFTKHRLCNTLKKLAMEKLSICTSIENHLNLQNHKEALNNLNKLRGIVTASALIIDEVKKAN